MRRRRRRSDGGGEDGRWGRRWRRRRPETIGRGDDDEDTKKKTTAAIPTFTKLSPRDNWWGWLVEITAGTKSQRNSTNRRTRRHRLTNQEEEDYQKTKNEPIGVEQPYWWRLKLYPFLPIAEFLLIHAWTLLRRRSIFCAIRISLDLYRLALEQYNGM